MVVLPWESIKCSYSWVAWLTTLMRYITLVWSGLKNEHIKNVFVDRKTILEAVEKAYDNYLPNVQISISTIPNAHLPII
jgi:hypothetical protein